MKNKSINLLEEWVDFLPQKIIDARKSLPTHKTMHWKRRDISDIKGLCTHQTLGGDDPEATAKYHIKYFNNGKGAPGLCYTFYVRKSGEIWWCNDIEDVVWSQGYAKRPGSENVDFLSIVVGGDFDGPRHKGKDVPTFNQLMSLMELYRWLHRHLGFGWDNLYLHSDFGKPACPGYVISNLVDAINEDTTADMWSDTQWQSALVMLGYDIGSFGPNKDGIDGEWGNSSKAGLVRFQSDNSLPTTGLKDNITKLKLETLLEIVSGGDR